METNGDIGKLAVRNAAISACELVYFYEIFTRYWLVSHR